MAAGRGVERGGSGFWHTAAGEPPKPDPLVLSLLLAQPFAIPAALFFALSIPLVLGVIPRNRFYGVRTRHTLSDDAVWYSVNRFGGAALMLASVVYAVIAVRLPWHPAADGDFGRWLIHLLAWVLPLAVASIVTIAYARER